MKGIYLIFVVCVALAACGNREPCKGEECKLILPHEEMVPQPAVKKMVCGSGYQMVNVITFREEENFFYVWSNAGFATWELCVPQNMIPKREPVR